MNLDYITLANGVKMPALVMSTNYMDYPLMKKVVTAGLKIGYRAFDTARDYGNEHVVGRVLEECLREQGLKRSDIFITTKIGNGQQVEGNISEQIDISLRHLHTDYIDLWLMHWPYPDHYIDTWRKMEYVYKKTQKVHAIGMANYRIRHFEHLFKAGIEIMPHCVQYECHPLRTADDLRDFCSERHIAIQAYSALCRMMPAIQNSEVLNRLAKKYNKTIAEIILRWHIQRGITPVFKSTKPVRLKENFGVWDFVLQPSEVLEISSMDQDYKYHLESASCPGY